MTVIGSVKVDPMIAQTHISLFLPPAVESSTLDLYPCAHEQACFWMPEYLRALSTQTLSGKAEEGKTLHSGLPTTEAQGDPSSEKTPKACKNWSMGRKMTFEGKNGRSSARLNNVLQNLWLLETLFANRVFATVIKLKFFWGGT